jgi:alcohol dehydrogenase
MSCRRPYRVRVEERTCAIEHPNDAIIRVGCAAICGSDGTFITDDARHIQVGTIFGHDFFGLV